MIGKKKKYIIMGAFIIVLLILAYIIKLVSFENKEEFSKKDNIVKEQILDFNQLEEETGEVEEEVSQDAEDSPDIILDSENNKRDDISKKDNKENEKVENNINQENANVENTNGNKDEKDHEEKLQPGQDTSNEYGSIN